MNLKILSLLFSSILVFNSCKEKKDIEPPFLRRSPTVTSSLSIIPLFKNRNFWETMLLGAEKQYGQSKSSSMIWTPKFVVKSVKDQINAIEQSIELNSEAILLSPIEPLTIQPAIYKAIEANIPVVFIDKNIEGIYGARYIYTSIEDEAQIAAKLMGEQMQGGGNLLILPKDSDDTKKGEKEKLIGKYIKQQFPGINIVSHDHFLGTSVENAFGTTERLLILHPDINGVLCGSPNISKGVVEAIRDIEKLGKVKIIGLGADEEIVISLKAGHIQKLIVQNSYDIGVQAVKSVQKNTGHKSVFKPIKVPPVVITSENVDDLKVRMLYSDKFENSIKL